MTEFVDSSQLSGKVANRKQQLAEDLSQRLRKIAQTPRNSELMYDQSQSHDNDLEIDSPFTLAQRSLSIRSKHRTMSLSPKRSKRSSRRSRSNVAEAYLRSTSKLKRRYEPTYRLESKNPFHVEHVFNLIKFAVEDFFISPNFQDYSPKKSVRFIQRLSYKINYLLLQQNYDRFRHIVLVTIIENQLQSFVSRAGFLWSKNVDNWTTYTVQQPTYLLNVTCFGVYWE